MGLVLEWSGLVVCGGQINDIEQEGEEERKKLKLGWRMIWAVKAVVGAARSGLVEAWLGWPELG